MDNGAVVGMMILAAYFLPTFAAARGRRGSVFVINAFFGWTFIGWVVALFMAVRSNENARGQNA